MALNRPTIGLGFVLLLKCLVVVVGALLKFDDPVINEMLSKFHAQ